MNEWELLTQVRQRVEEEVGTLYKQASLRIAFCHPSPYSAAMSSLGFQTIYREINQHPGAGAERAFLPDDCRHYRRNHVPLFTYESETPVSEFNIVAFSIAYELELTGLLEMLDLAAIPLLRTERSDRHPLIIAGGPLTYSNPAPLAPFVDVILLGEGEELIHTLLDKAAGANRRELLSGLSACAGFYVPGQTPDLPPVAKAADGCLPAYSQILTKNTVLASMFLIEPERGCSRSCTYCVMRSTTNRGMRLVAPGKVMSLIPEHAGRVGLVGAAVADHPKIKKLIHEIVNGGREIGISSLRADRLDEELVQLLAQGGYRTLTTASDGASQRLRNIIGRTTSERNLLHTAELVKKYGLQRMKLYQMIGLPDETNDDIDELARFSLELAKITPLSLSISPFVAKRNTPMDGTPFEPIPSLQSKLSKIRSRLKGRVDVLPASVRWAWVEYMLSQSDESAGLAAMDAWKAGGSFAAWKRAFLHHRVQPFKRSPGA